MTDRVPTPVQQTESHQGKTLVEIASHFIHRHFLGILLVAYLCAAILPQFGTLMREIRFGQVVWPDHSKTTISLSLLMLSFLLFNAGLGIKIKELAQLRKRPSILNVGFAANTLVPIALVLALSGLMHTWHNSDELQNLLVGLAMIISMPIAGSSTAWAQNANGNLSLSLGLVLLSTLLSPFTTPFVLHLFGNLTTGDYAEELHTIAAEGTNGFMLVTVVLPSLLGIITHFVCGERAITRIRPYLKLSNFVVLLLLNYSNAAITLPQAFARPDVDFLVFIFITTLVLCSAAYMSGWLVAKWFRADKSDQAALMFGLGMNNNGTGLVLAAATMADHPAVFLPMIFYTLIQQTLAAVIDWKMFGDDSEDEVST